MGITTISQAVWVTTLVAIVSKPGKATLNIKPSDAVVLQNGSTFFNCSTFNFSSNSEEIAWYHSVGSFQRKDVYEDGEIRTNYQGRFHVEKDLSRGVVNLVVQTPTLEDGGRYECQDGNGIGETAHAQLIVLETEPVCRSNIQPDGVIGSNDCGINPDQVEMSCSVKYGGNIHVHLEWRNGLEDDNSSLAVECSNTTNHSTCNMTVTGDRVRNNSVYICQIKKTGTNAYSCSSDVIKTIHVKSNNTAISVNGEDEIRCSVNGSHQCLYTWYSGEKNVSASERLKPTKSGQYLCKATCNIRGQTCIVTASNLNISIEVANQETNKAGLIAGVIVSFIILAITSTIGIVLWRQYQKNQSKGIQSKGDTYESLRLQDLTSDSGSNHTAPTETHSSAKSKGAVDSAISVEKACNETPYIDKGLSGHIHGPRQYAGKQCAFEKIMFRLTTNQKTAINEGEMSKEDQICRRGRKWMELDHCNLIKFYDVVLKAPAVFIAMEYAAGGSAREVLETLSENLPVPVALDWATQIAKGMNYLHKKGIVHRSLKCAQILIMEPVDSSTIGKVTIKVASYSLTCGISQSNPITFKGMFAWMAPEAIAEEKYSIHSDIWSYGVTIWEIVTREIPYNESRSTIIGELIKGIPNGTLSLNIPESCPQVLRDIIKECFNVEPKRRPKFSKILTRLCN